MTATSASAITDMSTAAITITSASSGKHQVISAAMKTTNSVEAVSVAMEMAERLAQKPNKALQALKLAIDIAADEPEDQAIAKALLLSDDVFDTNDAREGARAFFHKEKPAFTHS